VFWKGKKRVLKGKERYLEGKQRVLEGKMCFESETRCFGKEDGQFFLLKSDTADAARSVCQSDATAGSVACKHRRVLLS
jgi:hypothetical protein